MLTDEVTSHRPQENQTFSNFILESQQVIRHHNKLHYCLEASDLLGNVCPVQTVDAVGPDYTRLPSLNLVNHSFSILLSHKPKCFAEEPARSAAIRENEIIYEVNEGLGVSITFTMKIEEFIGDVR